MKKGFEYQYFIKDHLGNTRVVLNQAGKILQQNSYYPFGMLVAGHRQSEEYRDNKYLYNGKELQADFGLDWYDYGARFYDAEVGRWHVMDNKAEKYYPVSPNVYALNNPILFLDPNGNDVRVSTATNKETRKKTVTFTVTLSVRNNSRFSNKYVSNRFNLVKNQIEKSYSGFDSKTNTEYITVVELDKNENDYVMTFTDDIEGASSFTIGKTNEIGNTQVNGMQVLLEEGANGNALQSESETSRTGAHEYGHSLGLRHGGDTEGEGSVLKSKTEANLMNQSKNTKSKNINTTQLIKAKNQVEKDQENMIRLENNDKYSKNHY